MKKLVFLLLLVLVTIFLFAGSGPVNSSQQKRQLPSRTNLMFALTNLTASSLPVAPPAEKVVLPEMPKAQAPVHKLRLVPKDDEAELWIQAESAQENQNEGQELQIYNSAGERVYYTKLKSNLQKVNLCNYKGGKYVIKVGEETFSMMII
jgi:hypothetical protein